VYCTYNLCELEVDHWNVTRKCTTLWGEPDRVHAQNMYMHLTVIRMWLNLRSHKIYTRVYTVTVSQAWL